MIYTTRDGTILDLTTPEGLRGLRIEIATRLGWCVEQQDSVWDLIDPEGSLCDRCVCIEYPAERRAFEHMMLELDAASTEPDGPAGIPRWPTDANAALTLCEEPHFSTLWHTNPPARGGWQARMHLQQEGPLSPTPALAICLAWLAYKDADATP